MKEKLKREIEQKLFNSRKKVDYSFIRKHSVLVQKILLYQKQFDNQVTVSQLILFFYQNIHIPPLCQNSNCKNYVKWNSSKKQFQPYCCSKCSNSDPNKDQIIIRNNLKKYGVPRASMTNQSKQKLLATNLQKYGVTSTAKLDTVKEKAKQTCLLKYKYNSSSVNNIKNLEQYQNRDFIIKNFIINNSFELYNFMQYFNCSQVAAHNTLKRLKIDYTKYSSRSTYIENFLENFLIDQKISYIKNDRTILNGKELDFYVPDYNFAIEINGLYWHSYHKNSLDKWFSKTRHNSKTNACLEKGIRLYHIFENEIYNIPNIWKSVLENALGKSIRLGARKCILKKVPKKDIRPFLEGNHLQGYGVSPIAYGLYYKDELMSIMTFASSKGRMDTKTNWELVRFCNKVGYNVQGAASRLLKAFRVEHPGSIKSYANRRWSNGNLYRQLGFEETRISAPNKFIINFNNIRNKPKSRLSFQKHKLTHLISYDKDKEADLIIIESGYGIIWDSGNHTFIKG